MTGGREGSTPANEGARPRPDPGMPTPPDPSSIPTERQRSPYASVLRLRNFKRLWLGMGISSLGDWIGLFALLSITNRLAPGNTLAIGGLMIFRMLPAFVVGPVAGVLLDRIDRRKAMVVSDVIRALLIASIPFATTLPMLYTISFMLETIALIWMPAKDALVPNIVPKRWLVAANSLTLFTTYGVFPVGALVFTGLVGVGAVLDDQFGTFGGLAFSQENLALWINTLSFIASAVIISRLRFPVIPKRKRSVRLRVLWDEVIEGLRYLRDRSEVARVMRIIAVALAGGAVVFSLGAPYTTEILRGGARGFGGIVAALGTGMGLGVLLLGFVGDRLPKAWVSSAAVTAGGVVLVAVSMVSELATALVLAGLFGACGGVAYATGFALIQEKVADTMRGRTFASVQIVIRVSLFVSLVAFPALAQLFATGLFTGTTEGGIRLSMAVGGFITCAAGALGALDVYRGRIDP